MGKSPVQMRTIDKTDYAVYRETKSFNAKEIGNECRIQAGKGR